MYDGIVIKIPKGLIFWMVIIAIFIKPDSIAELLSPQFDTVLDMLRVLIAVIVFSLYVMYTKISTLFIACISYKLCVLLITIFNNGSIIQAFNYLATAIVLTIFIEWGIENEVIVDAIYCVLIVYLIINLVTILMFPKGMYISNVEYNFYLNWFLGWKTTLPLYIIPEMLLSLLFFYNTGSWIHIIFFGLGAIQPFLETTGGGSAAVLIFVTTLILSLSKFKKYINLLNSYLGLLLGSFLLIVMNVTSVYGKQIIEWFGKDPTLTTRTTVLWPINIKAFLNKPFIGYGLLGANDFDRILDSHRAHNMILAILVSSGIVGFFLFSALIMHIHKETITCLETGAYSICISSTTALFFAGLTEAFDYLGTAYIIFPIFYYMEYLFKNKYILSLRLY